MQHTLHPSLCTKMFLIISVFFSKIWTIVHSQRSQCEKIRELLESFFNVQMTVQIIILNKAFNTQIPLD